MGGNVGGMLCVHFLAHIEGFPRGVFLLTFHTTCGLSLIPSTIQEHQLRLDPINKIKYCKIQKCKTPFENNTLSPFIIMKPRGPFSLIIPKKQDPLSMLQMSHHKSTHCETGKNAIILI